MTYEVWSATRRKWIAFHYCRDAEEARQRFQWAYGYWPGGEVRVQHEAQK